MAIQYRTKEGDVLDEICYSYYGSSQAIHAVLEANPGLAENGTVFEAGVEIILPDYSAEEEEDEDVLWS